MGPELSEILDEFDEEQRLMLELERKADAYCSAVRWMEDLSIWTKSNDEVLSVYDGMIRSRFELFDTIEKLKTFRGRNHVER